MPTQSSAPHSSSVQRPRDYTIVGVTSIWKTLDVYPSQNVPESLDKVLVPPSTRPQHVKIKNWGSGEILQDTLHHKATSVRSLGLWGASTLSQLRYHKGPLWVRHMLPWLSRQPSSQTKDGGKSIFKNYTGKQVRGIPVNYRVGSK